MSVSKVIAAFKGTHGRSEVYRWLWDRYEELSRARQGSGMRADWVGAAEEMNRLGIKARGGKPVTSETLRRTWARVERDAKAAGRTVTPAVQKPAPSPTPAADPDTIPDAGDDFRLTSIKPR